MLPPNAMAVAVLILLTDTGTRESVLEPCPNIPPLPLPQHFIDPPESNAHACPKLIEIPMAVLMLLTETAVLLLLVELFPNLPTDPNP